RFVNAFQKYYKDGSDGTWDCRWFAGFFILFKLFAYLAYALSLGGVSFILVTLVSLIAAITAVIVEPYKEEYRVFNGITADLYLCAALIFTLTMGKAAAPIFEAEYNDHWILSVAFLGILPLVYITLVILHHLIMRFRGQKAGDGLTSSLPHRLLHPDQYRDTCGYIATISAHCGQSS
ncbi:hypothetical protein GBAR_LOCUS14765, partial [Geodia barretti]